MVDPLQLSSPTGVVYVAIAEHKPTSFDLTIFAGQEIVGFSVSFTVTVKEHVVVLLLASVTLNVFVVTPIGNAAPLESPAVCVVVDPLQLSAPTGAVYVATAEHNPASFDLTMFAGHEMLGFSVSFRRDRA